MEQNQNNNEIEIDLGDLFRALWAKKFIIILAGIAAMLAAVVVSKVAVTEMYQSKSSIYIYNKANPETALTASDLNSGSQLAKDFEVMMTSPEVMEKVVNELNLNMSAGALEGIISMSIETDTRILEIAVKHSDPYKAQDIADAVRVCGSEKIMSIIDGVSVEVVHEATTPGEPVSPNVKKNGILGALAGIALAVFVVLLVHLLDDTIKTPEDVEKYLGVSVLGVIPIVDGNKKGSKKSKRKKAKKGAR